MEPSTGWEITEPDGSVRIFNYYGLLISREDRNGHKTSYVYDDDFLLTEIITAAGKSIAVTMNDDGCITEIVLPDGETLTYEYDDNQNLISVTNPEGDEKRYEYDEKFLKEGLTKYRNCGIQKRV